MLQNKNMRNKTSNLFNNHIVCRDIIIVIFCVITYKSGATFVNSFASIDFISVIASRAACYNIFNGHGLIDAGHIIDDIPS